VGDRELTVGHLLDTHVWIWSQSAPERLGPASVELLSDPHEALYISTVSTLEIARLAARGQIEIRNDLNQWVRQSLELLLCSTIELDHAIALASYALPGDFHRDPADRILVATARLHGLILLTADERILAYPHVETRDARR
jgi:PIN domain nuclease of toxin-antitoxin system